jgi:hypothetical protein
LVVNLHEGEEKEMKRRLVFAALSAMFSSGTVLADGPGWTANSKVVRIVVASNGGINVRLSPELSGCTSQSGYGPVYASIYPDHPGLNRMHAILLAAYTADKPVALYLTDNTCKVTEAELGGRY